MVILVLPRGQRLTAHGTNTDSERDDWRNRVVGITLEAQHHITSSLGYFCGVLEDHGTKKSSAWNFHTLRASDLAGSVQHLLGIALNDKPHDKVNVTGGKGAWNQ